MKRPILFCNALLVCLQLAAQKIQTIVPEQPVVVGNAFQIQYVLSEPSDFVTVITPPFENLRLISGPDYYKINSEGNAKMQGIKNITYTVIPLKTGRIPVKGILVQFKDAEIKSADAVVTVVPQPRASFTTSSSYTDMNLYAPSSKTDLENLVKENLFVRTEVDKKTCYPGEPLVVTFKLYSRLQSVSEVINAPSLYGFGIMDILDINEAHPSVERINGKIFNAAILRKMQLYPVQTGKLLIDEMQLNNEVEFKDPVNGEKIKVEKWLASNPVEITVKPLPGEPPQNFSGAVGQFAIKARWEKGKIEISQQGKLIVTISGSGNFIQFSEPSIPWPDGFDVFDPDIWDHLNKNEVPVAGSREYVFRFTKDSVGKFYLPSISFSYFDPSTKNFKTLETGRLPLEIIDFAKSSTQPKEKIENNRLKRKWIVWALAGIMAAALLLLQLKRKKRQKAMQFDTEKTDYLQKLQEIYSFHLPGRQFCLAIQKLLTEVNKNYPLSEGQKQELLSIQNDCRLLIYSDIEEEGKEEQLKKRTLDLLSQLP